MAHFFIGVDGGATKSVVRIENEEGKLIAQSLSGPANIRISVDEAWNAIFNALNQALMPLDLSLSNPNHIFSMGMGLAGTEIKTAYQQFIAKNHLFKNFIVTSDAHTACLGAHKGKDGAIIIAGTGVIGFKVIQNETHRVSGYGFPHDDEGSGAWLGLKAIKKTLKTFDKRELPSHLTNAILAHFDNDQTQLIDWANKANSTAYAELAPIIIKLSQSGDAEATALLKEAALYIDKVGKSLMESSLTLPCSLLGGISTFIKPYLSCELNQHLKPAYATPEVGAIYLIKNFLATNKG